MYGARNSDSTSYTTIECRRRPHVSAWDEALGRGNPEEIIFGGNFGQKTLILSH